MLQRFSSPIGCRRWRFRLHSPGQQAEMTGLQDLELPGACLAIEPLTVWLLDEIHFVGQFLAVQSVAAGQV